MKRMHCKNPKLSYIFDILSIICGKCGSNDEKTFNQYESIEISEILGLINNV